MDEMMTQSPAEVEEIPLRQRVPQWGRILLQLLSFFLCIALFLCLLVTALVADLRQLLHADTMEQLMQTTLSVMVDSLPENIEEESGDSLVVWAHQALNEALAAEGEIPLEAVQTFFRESTVLEYLAEKTGTAVSEVLTQGYIESELLSDADIRRLVEENRELMNEQFGLELTDAHVEQVVEAVRAAMDEQDLNGMVEQAVGELLDSQEPVALGPVSLGMTNAEFLAAMLTVLSGPLWASVLGSLLLVLALLAAANFYNLPAATTWAGVPMLLAGGLLALPLVLIKDFVASLSEGELAYAPLIETCVGRIAPVHYGTLICGALLLLGGILWRILRAHKMKK